MGGPSLVVKCMVLALITPMACAPADEVPSHGASESTVIDPDLTIGLIDGDSLYLFGDIRSIAVDTSGRIYVGDRIGATIRAYDRASAFLKRIAREGGGPGEIAGWPANMTMSLDGRLYVRDASSITVFAPAQPSGVADSVAATWPFPGYGNLLSTPSRVGDSGDYYYPYYILGGNRPPRHFYLRLHDGLLADDTLAVPQYPGLSGRTPAYYRAGPSGGRMVDGLSHVPFAELPAWDVTHAGTLVSSDAARYELIETTTAGDTLRVIRGPTSVPGEIPAAERTDSARALAARLDTLPVSIDEVVGLGEGVRDRRLPITLPALISIHVAMDGLLWIETWPAEGQGTSRFYDILNGDGMFRSRVVLRAPLSRDPPPFFGSGYVVGVIRNSETGVERVVRFTIPKSVTGS